MLPSRILQVPEVAEILGRSANWVRRVARDAERRPKDRKYPPEVHAAFPPLKKHGRSWEIWGPRLQAHLENLSRKR